MGTVTSLLEEVREGRAGAPDRLFAHVYDDLKMVARSYLRKYRGDAFQATELVNAAYERIAAKHGVSAADRRQFFFMLSRAMHDVLVEHVRADLALKRGGGHHRLPLIEISLDSEISRIEFLDLHEALADLGAADPDAARVVILRTYSGLTLAEIAESMGFTFAVTRRHWEYAKAWLHERLSRSKPRMTENM